jgi:hypothetical protein
VDIDLDRPVMLAAVYHDRLAMRCVPRRLGATFLGEGG